MKKLIGLAGGALVAASASMALFGIGVASAAPDVVGQPYADAAEAIEDEGGTPIIASTVGGRLPQDECIVTNAWDAPFLRDVGGEFSFDEDEVNVALNCNGGHATASSPGASVASPAGRESKAAADEAEALQNEQDELAMAGETPAAPGE